MESKDLAFKITEEMKSFPVITQTIVKNAIESIKSEVAEGKVLLADMFESEEKFVDTLTEIIDLETNTGFIDPVDRPIIKMLVQKIVVGALKKALGADWLEDIKKIIA